MAGTETRERLQLRSPRDVLEYAPKLLGFTPVESIVVLTVHEPGVSVMRVDIPTDPALIPEQIAQLAELLCRLPNVSMLLPSVFTAAPWKSTEPPHAEILTALRERLSQMGFLVRDLIVSAGDSWGTVGGARHPLTEIPASPTQPYLEDIARIPESSPAQRIAFANAQAALRGRTLVGDVIGQDDPIAIAERALDPEAGPLQLAQLLTVCHQTPQREIALYALAWGRPSAEALAGSLLAGTASPDPRIALDLVGQGAAEAPSRRRRKAMIATMTRLASLTRTPADTALALSLLGWAHYASGNGSVAVLLLDRALSLAPDFPMASLLSDVLASGALPRWLLDHPRD